MSSCPECKQPVAVGVSTCPGCGAWVAGAIKRRGRLLQRRLVRVTGRERSDYMAGLLGLLLGPVGLWYKRNWVAGFAWLALGLTAGMASTWWLAPIFWFGMAGHAFVAKLRA